MFIYLFYLYIYLLAILSLLISPFYIKFSSFFFAITFSLIFFLSPAYLYICTYVYIRCTYRNIYRYVVFVIVASSKSPHFFYKMQEWGWYWVAVVGFMFWRLRGRARGLVNANSRGRWWVPGGNRHSSARGYTRANFRFDNAEFFFILVLMKSSKLNKIEDNWLYYLIYFKWCICII